MCSPNSLFNKRVSGAAAVAFLAARFGLPVPPLTRSRAGAGRTTLKGIQAGRGQSAVDDTRQLAGASEEDHAGVGRRPPWSRRTHAQPPGGRSSVGTFVWTVTRGGLHFLVDHLQRQAHAKIPARCIYEVIDVSFVLPKLAWHGCSYHTETGVALLRIRMSAAAEASAVGGLFAVQLRDFLFL